MKSVFWGIIAFLLFFGCSGKFYRPAEVPQRFEMLKEVGYNKPFQQGENYLVFTVSVDRSEKSAQEISFKQGAILLSRYTQRPELVGLSRLDSRTSLIDGVYKVESLIRLPINPEWYQ